MTRKGKATLGYALIALGFGLFMAGPLVVLAAGFGGITVALPAMFGFLTMAAGGVVLATGGVDSARAPTTPGVVSLECPNCGASARTLDADGFATCEYCGTRFTPAPLAR